MPHHQQLPANGERREALRQKGQFWTPIWLARLMARWVIQDGPRTLFDPAVGPGTFFAAARAEGFQGAFAGSELHKEAFADGEKLGLSADDFRGVGVGDFIRSLNLPPQEAIISNPPYIRHHRLDEEYKAGLKLFSQSELGFALDGRVGLHVYFLIKCLALLNEGGRLAFLLPADVCEGVSSRRLWSVLARRYRLDAVLTFEPSAAPFPKVDTNAMVLFMSKHSPTDEFLWARAATRETDQLWKMLSRKRGANRPNGNGVCLRRSLSEGVTTGLSRPPISDSATGLPLSRFARVMRGIATGENDFFLLTRESIEQHGLPTRYFKRAIARTRDCQTDIFSTRELTALEASGRPTWLLSLGKFPKEIMPAPLCDYLARGEGNGLHLKSLIKSRNPWYKMEERIPPPLLFAYLGRRDCRFIRNTANVVPLTGFLCVYPHDSRPDAVDRLWRALNSSATIANLQFVGKSYGDGALKVEPGRLADLIIPQSIIEEFDLQPTPVANQVEFV